MITPARRYAHKSLVRAIREKAFSDLEIDRTLRRNLLQGEDRALYSRLYFGVIEKKITLDWFLSQLCDTPLNRCEPELLALLELGLYQILFADRIPDHAAIHESVEIAKSSCREASGLVNAVLRRAAREKEALWQMLPTKGKKALSIRYGYPRWMISLWQEAYGAERCLEILEAQNTPAPLTLRIHPQKTSVAEYEKILSENGIASTRNPLSEHALTVKAVQSPAALPFYDEGFFFVQDAAAQHAIDRLSPQEGEAVLDLCAAPGGKSFAAALAMNNRGQILSLELYEHRLERIRSGAERLGIDILRAEQSDSSKPHAALSGRFDRVICDVPCSGYGTIAKKPDIRHKNPDDAKALPELQMKILESGADALKAGGRLLYSTCTLSPAENEEVTDSFLERHPEFSRIGSAETIFPIGGVCDGFFCDLLEKTK